MKKSVMMRGSIIGLSCIYLMIWDQRKNLRDFHFMHII